MWMFLTLACHLPASGPTAADADRVPVKVETTTVAIEPMPSWLVMTGTLVSSQQAQVAADATGVITSVRVERGQKVHRGDVLAEVDTRITDLSARAGAYQAEAVDAQLKAAEADCKRTEQLFSQQVIAQAQYERAMAGCQAQRASLQAARANAAMATTNVAKAQIRAPFEGTVGEKLVEVGNFVQAASPVVSLYGAGLLRVRFTVPEASATLVDFNQRVEVLPVADREHPVPGTVRFLGPALREQTRDRVVEAELVPTDRPILPGMFAEVRVEVAQQPSPVVPKSAIVGDDMVHRLFLVREGRAFEVVVKTGSEREGMVAVQTDLREGDVVVLNPPATLHDGQKVE